MILDLLEQGDARQLYLFQGARNLAELYNRELFEGLERNYPNFHYIPALNDPLPEDHWQGFTGFVHEAAMSHFDNRFSGHRITSYNVCYTKLLRKVDRRPVPGF